MHLTQYYACKHYAVSKSGHCKCLSLYIQYINNYQPIIENGIFGFWPEERKTGENMSQKHMSQKYMLPCPSELNAQVSFYLVIGLYF